MFELFIKGKLNDAYSKIPFFQNVFIHERNRRTEINATKFENILFTLIGFTMGTSCFVCCSWYPTNILNIIEHNIIIQQVERMHIINIVHSYASHQPIFHLGIPLVQEQKSLSQHNSVQHPIQIC